MNTSYYLPVSKVTKCKEWTSSTDPRLAERMMGHTDIIYLVDTGVYWVASVSTDKMSRAWSLTA